MQRVHISRRTVVVVAIAALATIGVSAGTPAAAPAGGVDPGTVELTLGPAQSATVAKRVTTPAVAPNPDIVILGDNTGSMDPVVASVRNNIDTIMDDVRAAQPNARFAVTAYKEQVNADKVFTVFTPLTDDADQVRAGIDNMSHDVFGGGAPWTDYINALYRIATDAVAFRPVGTRIILWFGDAVSHDPSLGHTLADTNAALRALGARVVAVPVVGTSGDGLDRLGQATSITTATQGRLMSNSNADQVADALLAGLHNLDLTVTPRITSCDSALSVAFDAASRTVRSGTDATFGETFRVSPTAAAGTYHCSVDFLVNGISQGFVQTTTVHVPGLSIGDVTVTEDNTAAVFPVTLDRPASGPVTVHVSTSDGTATAPGDYTSTSVDVRFEAGETSKSVQVPIVGDSTAEPDETFTVGLSAANGAAVTDGQGVGTVIDNDGGGVPNLSVGDVTIAEGNSGAAQAIFTVSLDRSASGPVSVRAATADGTATVADGDYAAASGTITFDPGQTSRQFTVTINGDTKFEPDESFTVELSAPTGANLLDSQGVGVITNDDSDVRPRVSVNDVTLAEGDSGTSQATFTISLDRAPTQGDVHVHWATADGTASASDNDFTAASGDETFTGGQTSRQFTVTINGDTKFEADETFTVELSAVSNADVIDGQGVGTIRNDDPDGRARLSVNDATAVAEGNSATTQAVFTVSLDRPSASRITVRASTVDGTASSADNDFTAVSRDLVFEPGQLSQAVAVDINGDTKFEPDESFALELFNASNADVTDGQGIGVILNDDSDTPPRVSIGDVTVTEGSGGRTQASFPVTLDRTPAGPVSVRHATVNGTAAAPGDFVAVSGDLTLTGSQVITVEVIGDLLRESTETFTVELSSPSGVTIADGQGVGTILDDDPNGDRGGVFTCGATAFGQVTANPGGVPCRDDTRAASSASLNLGLLRVTSGGLTATTELTPDDLGGNPAAAGDNGTARAQVSALKIRVLAVTIEVGVISSTAVARCVAGPNGLVPAFSGSSAITALKINGVAVPVSDGPVRIPLLVGTLELNTTQTTASGVTQRAFALTTLLGNVIVGVTSAGVHGSGNPSGNPCHR